MVVFWGLTGAALKRGRGPDHDGVRGLRTGRGVPETDVLKLLSTEIPGVTVTESGGTINVLGYGPEKSASSVAFTLEFQTLKTANTEVAITSARVDNSGNAAVKNASEASIIHDRSSITVCGYPVTLPVGFRGAELAQPGADYTFSVPDDAYDYDVKVTVGGKPVEVTKNPDGSCIIPAELVTGGQIISVLPGDLTGDGVVEYDDVMTAYRAFVGEAELTAEQMAVVDSNANGQVDEAEFEAIYRIYIGG